MPDDTLISFVIIAYNEADHIARTLVAITQLDDLGGYEIIVVDDGSRDNTAQVVTDVALQYTDIRLIELPENHGRGYARATGIAAARGELIAMVDADITLPTDWLMRTRTALKDHDAVGGTAVPDGDVAYICRRFGLAPRAVSGTAAVTGNNGLYRRAVFKVTNFDAALREGEDIALNHAMEREGLSAATVPGLFVRHEESKTLGASLRWLFDSGRGATRQLLTYRQIRQPDLATGAFAGATALGAYLMLRKRSVLGAMIPVGFVLAASTQHVRTRFQTSWSHWPRIAPAVAVDGALLTAYFSGRLAGLSALRHPASRQRVAAGAGPTDLSGGQQVARYGRAPM